MATGLQQFMATAIPKAAADLETALLNLPEDKRSWSPSATSRSAIDQVAEVAMLNGSVQQIIETHKWNDDYDFEEYLRKKAEFAKDEAAVLSALKENSEKIAEIIGKIPDSDLAITVQMPWGPMTMSQIIAYPYWNASYHEGQINYIASILGCQK